MTPNPTTDDYYNRVALRFAALTQDQRSRVYQRLRVKASIGSSVYLMAMDSEIDLELSGMAPEPQPCPEHKPFGAPPPRTCVVHPVGPLAQNPKWK